MISEPYFVEEHSRFSKDYGLIVTECPIKDDGDDKQFLIKIKNGKVYRQSLHKYLSKGGEIKACCNGLLLIDTLVELVVNPTTNQTMELPPCTSHRWKPKGFAFVSATHEYKIARLIQVKKSELACEILAFNGFESDKQPLQWRSIEVPRIPVKRCLNYRPISVNGFLHWIDNPQHKALSLDAGAEKFYWTPLPNLSLSKGGFVGMGSFLAFVKYREPENLEIWILEDVYNGRWVHQRSITVHSRIIESTLLCSFENG